MNFINAQILLTDIEMTVNCAGSRSQLNGEKTFLRGVKKVTQIITPAFEISRRLILENTGQHILNGSGISGLIIGLDIMDIQKE